VAQGIPGRMVLGGLYSPTFDLPSSSLPNSTLLFYLLMAKTKTVKAINATALNLEGQRPSGDVAEIYARTMGISARAGGAAGALIAPIMTINSLRGWTSGRKSFVVAILEELGSTMGALVAAWPWTG